RSILYSLVIIFIIIAVIFKSPMASLFQLIPLIFSIVVLFGFMGWFQIDLNFTTALLSSIMIGVGIDYTTHFCWHVREHYISIGDLSVAIEKTLSINGRGIILNALSVMIGFSALIFSEFLNVRFFGLLMILMIGTCLLGALVVVPAFLIQFQPKFIINQRKCNG
ncbi:MAG: MMPL family transporter, partial [Bacteroidales bacterium]|nr:MMPL family transporter [Bacteroidales bacterium]